MNGTAVFALSPAPTQGITGIYVRGTTGNVGTFTAAGSVSIAAGAATFSVPVSSTALPLSRTEFFNPLNINWDVAQSGNSCANGCQAAGTSSNPVYVTLAGNVLPFWAQPIMLTYISLAVGNGGAVNQATAFAQTWSKFSTGIGPANVRTWDNYPLSYYITGFGGCAVKARDLVINLFDSGQCGAFALPLESALAVNGIHSKYTGIGAFSGDLPLFMLIKNWCFIGAEGCPAGPGTYAGSEIFWKYQARMNTGDFMVPERSDYGDLFNRPGIAGQNGIASPMPPYTPTPLEKFFGSHYIVKVPLLDGAAPPGNRYFDPSYGVSYSSEAGFEAAAIAGYAYRFPDDLLGTYHARTPIAGYSSILFFPDPSQSMPSIP